MSVSGARRAEVSTVTDCSDVLRLPHTPASVAAARRWVRRELTDLGVGGTLLDDVEVVVSELLGNAVRHARPIAGGALLVAWRWTGSAVTVTVTDAGSPGRVELRGTGRLDESGRGLRIVEGLATEWGVVERLGGLRTVWASVGPDPGGAARHRGHGLRSLRDRDGDPNE